MHTILSLTHTTQQKTSKPCSDPKQSLGDSNWYPKTLSKYIILENINIPTQMDLLYHMPKIKTVVYNNRKHPITPGI